MGAPTPDNEVDPRLEHRPEHREHARPAPDDHPNLPGQAGPGELARRRSGHRLGSGLRQASGTSLQIEQTGEHEYLVRLTEAENQVQFLIRAAPSVLTQLGFQPTQEAQVVTATAPFLIGRQPAADLPDVVDLDDVAAVYDDYLAELTKGLP